MLDSEGDQKLPDDLIELAKKLDPDQADPAKTHPQGWLIKLVLGLVILIPLMLGFLNLLDVDLFPQQKSRPTEAAVPSIRVSGTAGGSALLLLGADGGYGEIKLLETESGHVSMRDLTLRKGKLLTAQFSNEPEPRVVYIEEVSGHRNVVLLDLQTGDRTALDLSGLGRGSDSTPEPCTWSPVAWAPEAARFAFFACGAAASELVVVEWATEPSPFSLENTEGKQSPARDVFWVSDTDLVFTTSSKAGETQLYFTQANAGADPQLVYVH